MTEHSISGIGVLDKAVEILDAIAAGANSIAAISRTTAMPKPTVHRLCAALEHHGLIVRIGEVRSLGRRAADWVGHADTVLQQLVLGAGPVLQQLRDETEESVQLYVLEGDLRRCIAALESTHGLRTIVEVGAFLPLDAGSAGAVLSGERVGRAGWIQSAEQRQRGVASVSAPVHGVDGAVVAAISVSGPIERTTRTPGRRYGTAVVVAARALSEYCTALVPI